MHYVYRAIKYLAFRAVFTFPGLDYI